MALRVLFNTVAIVLTFTIVSITATKFPVNHLLIASNLLVSSVTEQSASNDNRLVSFGFRANKGLHDKIFSDLVNITIVDADESRSAYDAVYRLPFEMKAPVAVGLIDSRVDFADEKLLHTNSHSNNLHLKIHTFVESVFRNSKEGGGDSTNKAKLVLIVTSNNNFDSIKDSLKTLVKDIAAMTPLIFKGRNQVEDVLDVFILDAADVANGIQAARGIIEGSGTERFIASTISTQRIATPLSSQLSGELDLIENNIIADEFIADVKASLGQITEKIDMKSMEKIATIINEAITRNYNAYESIITTSTSSKWLRNTSMRAKLELLGVLKGVFANILENELVNSYESYEMAVKKVPPTKKLISNLNKIASQTVDSFMATARAVRKDMVNILTTNSNAVGLFSSDIAGNRLSLADSINPSFGYTYEVNSLRLRLSRSIPEMEKQLFVSGAYNPFMREAPYPPTRVNLNYLINPATALQSIGYDRLYDDNDASSKGTDRADSLHFPGFAQFPFDPNDNPVPKDNKPWYQILIDLYKN